MLCFGVFRVFVNSCFSRRQAARVFVFSCFGRRQAAHVFVFWRPPGGRRFSCFRNLAPEGRVRVFVFSCFGPRGGSVFSCFRVVLAAQGRVRVSVFSCFGPRASLAFPCFGASATRSKHSMGSCTSPASRSVTAPRKLIPCERKSLRCRQAYRVARLPRPSRCNRYALTVRLCILTVAEYAFPFTDRSLHVSLAVPSREW